MAFDARAFTAFEHAAHDRIAASYAEHFVPLTSLTLAPLLQAAKIKPGQKVLDATGPGLAAGAAQRQGAVAVGVDVSPGRVELAKRRYPSLDFQIADAVALPFADATFEAGHLQLRAWSFSGAEMALSECVRTLGPGGVLAISWWDMPDRQRVQGLFCEVIAEMRLLPLRDVRQGHNTLRFSDPAEFAALLHRAGLEDVQIVTHQIPDGGRGGIVARRYGRNGGHSCGNCGSGPVGPGIGA